MLVKDANAILAKSMKLQSEQEKTKAMIKIHSYLTDKGFTPQRQILDKEWPSTLKCYLIDKHMTL